MCHDGFGTVWSSFAGKFPVLFLPVRPHIDQYNQVIIYVLIVLAASLIGARVYLRLVIQKQHLLASDYFMVAAWCSAFTTASFDVVMLKEGVLEPEIDYTLVNWEEPEPETIAYMLKVRMILESTFRRCPSSMAPLYIPFYLDRQPLQRTRQSID